MRHPRGWIPYPPLPPGDGVGHFTLLAQRHGRHLIASISPLLSLLISRPLLLVVHNYGLGLQHLANVGGQSRQLATLILQVGTGTSRSGVGVLLQSHLVVVAVGLIGNSLLMNGAIAVLATFATSVIGHHLVLGSFARRLAMMMMWLVLMLLVVLGLMVLILITTAAAMPCAMGHHNAV